MSADSRQAYDAGFFLGIPPGYFAAGRPLALLGSECLVTPSPPGRRFGELDLRLLFGVGQHHANVLLVDWEELTLERFEPHGTASAPGGFGGVDIWDDELSLVAKRNGLRYVRPGLFHCERGPQVFDSRAHEGRCASWCRVWTLLRNAYPEMPLANLYAGLTPWASRQAPNRDIERLTLTLSRFVS